MPGKGHFTFFKVPLLEPHHQMLFSVIFRALVLFNPYKGSYLNRYYHSVRVVLGVLVMKGYSTFPNSPVSKSDDNIQFSKRLKVTERL